MNPKRVMLIAALYVVLPFDLVPEALLGPFGLIDDLLAGGIGLKALLSGGKK